jgi:glucose-6-phosphate 1-epimerase
MQLLAELNSRFAIPGTLRFDSGQGNLTRAVITTPHAEAHVYLHGAHVTHYQPAGQSPVLFMSRESHFAPDKPIRGGIPVIFPWFGPRAGDPTAPAHGFARTMEWSVAETKPTGSAVGITLALKPSDSTRRWFAQEFELLYTVTVGTRLEVSLEVRNRSTTEFTFEEALHTYLAVSDVRQVKIDGLDGVTFIDKTAAQARLVQSGPIRIERETDRVYLGTTGEVTVTDPATPAHEDGPKPSEFEMRLLASMMLDGETIRDVITIVDRTRFRDPRNRVVFDALIDLHQSGRLIDAVLLRDELVRRDLLDLAGGAPQLAAILNSVPSAERGVEYARLLSNLHQPRQIAVAKRGSRTTVVWNPWIAKAKAMPDFGDEEWPGMLCIETANAADNLVTLAPEQSQVMSASISVRAM